jgi:signal transduction histidine kinase
MEPDHPRHKVLVVDDDAIVREVLGDILARDDLEVTLAASGREALLALEEGLPCMVLTDVEMPGMGGLELCRRLKQDPRTAGLPVALVTSRLESSDVEAGLAAGAVDYVKKPFDQAELRMRVRSQIRLHEAIREERRLEVELAHARKLEAVGQLASGIAHEINTPCQFVGDSVHFLSEAFGDYRRLLARHRALLRLQLATGEARALVEEIRALEEEVDLDFLEANVPAGFARCVDGVARISTIVRAMKEFAHPDQREQQPADLNQALRTTLTIARNEFKYVADAETDLGELPPVLCHVGDLNQVFLNLIVNAAHAIAEAAGPDRRRGLIRIRTAREGDQVRIDVSDTGAGIPVAVRHRIFEPFFTTKAVGKGTGQGLAIARSIVVDKHGGSLAFESELGKGTTFTVRLPIDGRPAVGG